ncbi:hypothetical protein DS745_06045 [Anaerobacillus alkaliphilus]|uniref:Uncharacterized protein n=1 Tax=Anaerobacillus alkaliphilus TaxID=1548597 RepID=A0A4Q0VV34_9BACI|nr:hypothetical protein [Anaerobacillus alkaliphilus]RXJ02531.1 hypothetical protein DS745_06045 [Anaerobacillus alkaliphilus]
MLKKKKTWEEIRSKGQLHFIIKQGIFGWGLPVAILVFFLTKLFEYGLEFTMYFNGEWIKDLLTNILFFQVGGIFFGWWMWKIGESKHQETALK